MKPWQADARASEKAACLGVLARVLFSPFWEAFPLSAVAGLTAGRVGLVFTSKADLDR